MMMTMARIPGVGLAKGLSVTLRHMLRKSVTQQYPEVKPDLPPRSRGVIALVEENCTSCMLCARECPDWCIYIDSHKETLPAPEGGRPRQRNVLDRFAIDFSLCMYCGICIEVCPFDALFWSPEFEYAEGDIRNLLHEKDRLAAWVPTVPPPPAHDLGAEPPKELAAAPRRPAAGPRAAGAPAGPRAAGTPTVPRTGDTPAAARTGGTTSTTPAPGTSPEASAAGTPSDTPSEVRPSDALGVGTPAREGVRPPAVAEDSDESERPSAPRTAESRATPTTEDVSREDVARGDAPREDVRTAETQGPGPSPATFTPESGSEDPAQATPTPESRSADIAPTTPTPESSSAGPAQGAPTAEPRAATESTQPTPGTPGTPGPSSQTQEPGQTTGADESATGADKPGRSAGAPERPARAAGRTRMANIRGIRPPGALPSRPSPADKPVPQPIPEENPAEASEGDISAATPQKPQKSAGSGSDDPASPKPAQTEENGPSAETAQGAQGEGGAALEPSSTAPSSGEELSTGSGEPQPNPDPEEQTSGPRPRRRRMADPRSIRPPGRLDPDDPREPEEE
ncbi:NuoI/complex I 23 kDa subunit family protein [Nonomuraea roseoviolacea]|nr:4Fe-4S binding protein [Nonomuraea roseoviolacea]